MISYDIGHSVAYAYGIYSACTHGIATPNVSNGIMQIENQGQRRWIWFCIEFNAPLMWSPWIDSCHCHLVAKRSTLAAGPWRAAAAHTEHCNERSTWWKTYFFFVVFRFEMQNNIWCACDDDAISKLGHFRTLSPVGMGSIFLLTTTNADEYWFIYYFYAYR